MPKRLIVCCDGTWNKPDQPSPTNVTKLALYVASQDPAGIEQRVFYDKGVGTGRFDHLLGGAFGVGLSKNVQDGYRFLVANYEPGDELFFFGFSRGAYTARSIVGFIRNSGLLKREYADKLAPAYDLYRRRDDASHPDAAEAELFRKSFAYKPRVKFIGVWDTVGAFGIPLSGPRSGSSTPRPRRRCSSKCGLRACTRTWAEATRTAAFPTWPCSGWWGRPRTAGWRSIGRA